jgi:uncharacterized protein (TIGR02284 family)
METTNNEAVKLLNGLIETTLDSAHGYNEAAKSVKDPALKTMFADRARKRAEIGRLLQQEVRSFGREPETDQSAGGKLHNRFVELKSALAGGSRKAVVDEVEHGEDVIKGRFEKALRSEDLPVVARSLVSRAYDSIRADHDAMSALKRSMH